jgi:transcriptional regulator with XRE-family HTH domain
MQTMGERIRLLREARGWTQAELAERVGVSRGAVAQWEGGVVANIRLQAFLKLTEELGTDVAYVVYGPTRKASVS